MASISSPSRLLRLNVTWASSVTRSVTVIAQVAGQAAQRAMDQDTDRALAPTERARDLGRGHLIDEAQDDRAAPVAGQPRHGAPRFGGFVPAGDLRHDVDVVRDLGSRFERRFGPAATGATTLRHHV